MAKTENQITLGNRVVTAVLKRLPTSPLEARAQWLARQNPNAKAGDLADIIVKEIDDLLRDQ